jgi:hypothetical protein
MTGGMIGQLFVLFGVKTHGAEFKAAHEALNRLKAAVAITGVIHLSQSLFHLAEEAAESATHVHSLSQAMGMSIGQAQRWAYVAEQSGSNLKELSVGVSMFGSNLRKLADGDASPKLRKMFRELHLTQADAKDWMSGSEGVDRVMLKTSARLKEIGVNGRAATDAYRVFGARAGRALMADMIRGPEAIKQMFANITAKGGIISDNSIIQLQNLYDSIIDIKKAWHGVSGELIGTLAPVLIKLLNNTALWFGQNREVIGLVLTAAIRALAAAFGALMVVVTAVAHVIDAAFKGNTGAQTAIITLTALLVSLLVPALFAVAGAAWAAVAPLILPTLIIAGIVYGLLMLRKHWDEVVAFMREHWMWFVGALLPFLIIPFLIIAHWDKVKAALLVVAWTILHALESVGDLAIHVGRAIGHALVDGWDAVVTKASPVLEWILTKAREIWGLFTAIGKAIEHVFSPMDSLSGVRQQAQATGASHERGFMGLVGERTRDTLSVGAQQPTIMLPGTQSTVAVNPPPGSPAALAAVRQPERSPTSVSVGPTTINITGVKDASEAKDHIADSIDGVHRHAAAALGGEVF